MRKSNKHWLILLLCFLIVMLFGCTDNQKETKVETQGGSIEQNAKIDLSELTFELYINMPAEEQMEVVQSFGSVGDFVKWYHAAEEKYRAEHPLETIDGNFIDIGDFIEP